MDIMSWFYHILGLGLLMFFSAFFSSSETALTALSRIQIKRMKEVSGEHDSAAVKFLAEPQRLFITVLFGNTLVNMAFISISGSLIYDDVFKGENPGLAYVIAILIQTFVLLIFGEITPKTFAIKYSEKLSKFVSQPLWLFSQLIYPFRKILRFFTDSLLPFFGVHSTVDRTAITSKEIHASVEATKEHGALDEVEGELLANIFQLQDTRVKEIMVPRIQMVCVEVSETIQAAFQKAKKAGHSRLPVFRRDMDNMCGIFHVKDMPRWKNINTEKLGKKSIYELTIDEFLSHQSLLKNLNPGHEDTLIRPPLFVFKTRDVGSLLVEMTKKKQHLAILLDEFGGVSGLVTAEDIIEEVLGEIVDEYDAIPDKIIIRDPSDPTGYLVPGSLSLRSVNKHLRISLDLSVADTISGYVTSLFGSIPNGGDVIKDSYPDIEFEVVKMKGNRIDLLKIRLGQKIKHKQGKSTLFSFFFLGMGLPLILISGGGGSDAGGSIPVLALLFLLISALSLLAFYAGSETAVVSASRARIDVMAQQGNKRALIIKNLLQEPDKMLGIVLVGTNLMSTAAGVAGLRLTYLALSGKKELIELVNTLVMTFFILFFCEILPKTIFRAKADTLAMKSASCLRISALFLYPVVSFISKITTFIVKFAKDENREERLQIMREELRLLAKMGVEEGTLKKTQLRMIQSILDLESRDMERVMTPLVDVVAVPENIETSVFLEKVAASGFSRIPVYRERIDNIIGLVNVLDVLYSESLAPTILPYVRRDIRHEPKSKRIFPLLKELTQSKSPMVFVVDEYGGTIGLVTVEDLVEEIMGDIRDERDAETDISIEVISDRVIDCDGKTEVQVLNSLYDTDIPEGDYITIAGYMVEKMQKIPKNGEILETRDLRILVLEADAKSIKRVRIINNRAP